MSSTLRERIEARTPAEGHSCPDDGAQLYYPESGDVVRSLSCPVDGSDRHCDMCGRDDGGAWMSGSCDSCYRRMRQEQEVFQRESAERMYRRWAIDEAANAASESGLADTAAWLRLYREGMAE